MEILTTARVFSFAFLFVRVRTVDALEFSKCWCVQILLNKKEKNKNNQWCVCNFWLSERIWMCAWERQIRTDTNNSQLLLPYSRCGTRPQNLASLPYHVRRTPPSLCFFLATETTSVQKIKRGTGLPDKSSTANRYGAARRPKLGPCYPHNITGYSTFKQFLIDLQHAVK